MLASQDERARTNTGEVRYCCDDEPDTSSLLECARRALEVQSATGLSDLVADFGIDVDTLELLASDEDQGLVSTPIHRHPIAYLYARRVAQLAGVALAGDEEAGSAYDAARQSCELLIAADGGETHTPVASAELPAPRVERGTSATAAD